MIFWISSAHFLLFLLMGASMAVTDTFLFLWLEELGGSRFLMGLALMCTCLSEVVVFAKEAAIKRVLSIEWSLRRCILKRLPQLTRAGSQHMVLRRLTPPVHTSLTRGSGTASSPRCR